ncbi:hypothetical protein PtA15_4A113 [Puccinia triticina]|uniref:Uncharacterized protein n=1 Tax=Puccinia triticina TaxID=208348 RepID=A0ABY7CF03_9BASI|nr:uncharacterized protein PtA15_4A113 [Puccinia triticina]WAQ83665.1 hypothetical protein PtA15_4A113 [Puccinia triticina]
MVSHQAKQEKLARKLLPNHSIRSDEQEVSSHQRRRPGSSSLPSSDKVEIEWFDWFVILSSHFPYLTMPHGLGAFALAVHLPDTILKFTEHRKEK